ncbi:MAG: sulfatase-like hydrolase/transferase [Kofleriaceae bacterium]
MKHPRIRPSHLAATAALGLLATAAGCGGSKDTPSGGGGSGSAGGAVGSGAAPGPAVTVAPSRGPEHPVYSLVDNRLSAHLLRGGGLLAAGGSAGLAKYVRFGNAMSGNKGPWALRAKQGDVPVARLVGSKGKLVVPLTAAELGSSTVRVRVFSDKAAPRPFSVRVNATNAAKNETSAQVQPGWSTVELAIPAGQLVEGENELLFFVGGGDGLDVAWIQVGGTSAPADDTAVALYDKDAQALRLPEGGGLAYYVTVPDKAVLTGDLTSPGCEVAVTATGEDGTVVTGSLSGAGAGVALGELAGKAARVTLTGAGCPEAKLAKAALVVPGAAPTAERGEAPKYVVFFVMDSLRADRVRLFNPDARPEAPTWDKLGETSAVFTNFYVQGNESQVSHASLWTSLYPIKHGKLGEKQKLDPKWVSIDEVAKTAGKFVAGVSANGYIRPKFGFGTGWDKYANHIEEQVGLRGEDVVARGLGFLGDRKDPWFLYLGTIDTHVSWRAKSPWIEKYSPNYSGRFAQTFSGGDAEKARSLGISDAEKAHVRALYDSNVSYQDDLLAKLIAELEAKGMWDQTMLIITADHGDEQWEDGRVGHGATNRDMLIHVPLLIHYPALLKPGRYGEGAESVDVTPTVADALGVTADAEWQGQSLIPLTQGIGAGYLTMAFNSMYEDRHAGRIGHWKVRTSGAGSSQVYDLAASPDEQREATGASAAIGGRVVSDPLWMLRQWNKDWRKAQWGNAANVTARFAGDLGE